MTGGIVEQEKKYHRSHRAIAKHFFLSPLYIYILPCPERKTRLYPTPDDTLSLERKYGEHTKAMKAFNRDFKNRINGSKGNRGGSTVDQFISTSI